MNRRHFFVCAAIPTAALLAPALSSGTDANSVRMTRLGASLVQTNGIQFAHDLIADNLPRIRQAESGAGVSLGDLMAQDFRSDRTVVVQGITFSAIEATQFAMAALAAGVAA